MIKRLVAVILVLSLVLPSCSRKPKLYEEMIAPTPAVVPQTWSEWGWSWYENYKNFSKEHHCETALIEIGIVFVIWAVIYCAFYHDQKPKLVDSKAVDDPNEAVHQSLNDPGLVLDERDERPVEEGGNDQNIQNVPEALIEEAEMMPKSVELILDVLESQTPVIKRYSILFHSDLSEDISARVRKVMKEKGIKKLRHGLVKYDGSYYVYIGSGMWGLVPSEYQHPEADNCAQLDNSIFLFYLEQLSPDSQKIR